MLTMPLPAPFGSSQLSDYREFLHRILENIPPRDRVDFIGEVMQSLDEEDRRAVMDAPENSWLQSMRSLEALLGFTEDRTEPTIPRAEKQNRSAETTGPEPFQLEDDPPDEKGANPLAAWKARFHPAAPPREAETTSEVVEESLPRIEVAESTEADVGHESAPIDQLSLQAKVEQQFKQFVAQKNESELKQNMRRELVSCLGLGVLGLAILIGLSIGAGKLWNYLSAYF